MSASYPFTCTKV